MEIVVRQELELKCRNVGREIITLASQNTVSDSDLDTVFKPLIDMVQEKTHALVEQSIDEFRAQMEDKEEENEMEDLLTSKCAHILEYTLVCEDDFGFKRVKDPMRRLKDTPNIKVTRCAPLCSNEISDDELLSYPKDNPYWDKYLNRVKVTIRDPRLRALYKGNLWNTHQTCVDNDINYSELCDYIDELVEAGAYTKYSSDLVLTARDLRRARRAQRAKAIKPY